MNLIALLLAALVLPIVPGPSSGPLDVPALQEPEDPGRVLNLLDGLVDRVQESSPILAAIIRLLAVIVYLILNIKYWGPSVLVTTMIVVGFLIWQGWRNNKQSPSMEEELENEPEV